MLVVVVEPFGMVKDEIAVDQVVEHQGSFLDRAVVFNLIFDLDVIILALVDPDEFAFRVIGIAELFANAPPLADVLESRPLHVREDLADRVDESRWRKCQDAQAQRNAGPDSVPDRAQERCSEGHRRSQEQDHPLGAQNVDQEKARQESAEDAADHAPGVDLADRGAGAFVAFEAVDSQLGHDGADRSERQCGQKEDERHDE